MTIKNRIKDLNKNKLTKLDLSALKITSVPKELTKSISDSKNVVLKIIELDLSFNQIKTAQFLEEFGTISNDFSSLEVLNLMGNVLLDFSMSVIKSPVSITKWNNICELNLSGCKITKVTNLSFVHLVKLRKLSLANNNIEVIEDQSFSYFKNTLEELSLAGNSIKQIPTSLVELKSLELLDLSGCPIQNLPDGLGNMISLLEMNLGNCKLTELPNSIGKLKRLCVLDIQNNHLNDLPLSIGYCIGLGQSSSGINIYGNSFSNNSELKSRQSKGAALIMDYLEKRVTLHVGVIPLGSNNSNNNLQQQSINVSIPSPRPSRPPQYDKINEDRPPQYQSIVSSSGSNGSVSIEHAINIPGPKPLREKINDILRNDIKIYMKQFFDAISQTNNNAPQIQANQLIAIGNILTPAQNEMDQLFKTFSIDTSKMVYNSPMPINGEDKILQIKKIINLKLEHIAVHSRFLLDYMDQISQPNKLSSMEYDKRISLINHTLQSFVLKLALIKNGSHLSIFLTKKYKNYKIIVIDKLDYCSNLNNLNSIINEPNFKFYKGNILDEDFLNNLFIKENIDTVFHLAAYTHVDESFKNSIKFTENNVLGTHYLLEVCKNYNISKFIYISTDEVYGSGLINDEYCNKKDIIINNGENNSVDYNNVNNINNNNNIKKKNIKNKGSIENKTISTTLIVILLVTKQ
ncbi:hypothetical protein DICPUDRAFT_157507 [Dictyostelium purpureum]|uniref:NAD(P)-binding domain-containing protein n=1 Tax=Dictyostelium purpureum TaxID=5786 RepID=F0ZZA7_DICPU|nr:uncharacterized protein DICPUDRAFT_157507 [Dictyostelium purpureum]EGC30716.1 hypothetical protein DICPUDRAFT_157507 [Dictyostelium purpureum]|eukprot:XP_003292751.1 hypothetical protein DICPUDRAFT_157507 [Dictyostelium purpureum]